MQWIETTKEAFNALVPCDTKVSFVKATEHYRAVEYVTYGVRVRCSVYFVSGVTTYSIQDINA